MQLEREAWRRQCKESYVSWCVEALAPLGQRPALHHQLICNEIQRVVDSEDKTQRNLMIFAPPGSAKTTYVARLSVPWIMQRKRNWSIIGASHRTMFAEENSSYALSYLREYGDFLGVKLKSENVTRWRTYAPLDKTKRRLSKGGDYLAAGVDAGISGFRADLAIIDDPIKGRQNADSETSRKSLKKWFHGDLQRRLKPEGRIILMHTRWHLDDLAGALLKSQPNKWRVISLPALATSPLDPLGREIGEPLWMGDEYGYGESLRDIRDDLEADGQSLEWSSLYQQNPVAPEGNLFKVDNFRYIDAVPHGTTFVRGWDLAATKDLGTASAAYTAGVRIGRTPDGKYIVSGVRRERFAPEDVQALLKATAELDGYSTKISIPQDPGQSGKFQVSYLTTVLAGHTVLSDPESGDKATRAGPFASQVNVGNVYLLRGAWNAAYVEELRAFPASPTKDQVDASSRAFSQVFKGGAALWAKLGQQP